MGTKTHFSDLATYQDLRINLCYRTSGLIHSSGFVLPFFAHLRSDPNYVGSARLNGVDCVDVVHEERIVVSLKIDRPFRTPCKLL